ncbi:helix-turn-helix transcriptional regulator [Propionispora vibrioides]|uniref:AraC-type DNA-binding protein n=1 Tax=Propionispora vibrioides TaxID=112903 RepID=A0A1H8UK64_9FIRM|nr:AraC family transcriptional regulator [Propionispora vibrioides]SEP03609.1 AraC-type DNA-binding protein [Propionispora vibrioides]
MSAESPIYSHNPYHTTKFPLLVLNVNHRTCTPFNEGFQVLHWHDEIQFVYILKGIVHVKIYDEEFDLQENDCIFINRTVLHHITEKENCHYHSYIIPARMLSFFSGSIMEQDDVETIINNPTFTHYLLRSNDPTHHAVLHHLNLLDNLYFQVNKYTHYEYRLSIQLSIIWLEFISLLPAMEKVTPSKNYERIRTLISIIHTNYCRPLSIQDIAAAAHISKTECIRCFQKFVHESPYQYLLKYRLHVSTSLLTTTDMSVTDIALNVGFHSISSYIKYFKMYYHTTPYKYRLSCPVGYR